MPGTVGGVARAGKYCISIQHFLGASHIKFFMPCCLLWPGNETRLTVIIAQNELWWDGHPITVSAKGCYHQPCLGYQPALWMSSQQQFLDIIQKFLDVCQQFLDVCQQFLDISQHFCGCRSTICWPASKVLLTANGLGQEISTLPNMVILLL